MSLMPYWFRRGAFVGLIASLIALTSYTNTTPLPTPATGTFGKEAYRYPPSGERARSGGKPFGMERVAATIWAWSVNGSLMIPMVLPPGPLVGSVWLWLGMSESGKLQPATKAYLPSGV